MAIKVKCRNCGVVYKARLRKRTEDERGASVTGIACIKCGCHKLRRQRLLF
jgi:hypothetical protein